MPTAIVTGATGITGSAIVNQLSKDDSWITIHTLSRSQPGIKDSCIKHASLDLQSSAEEMAESLKDVSADCVFFCAYLADNDPSKAVEINGRLLSRFLEALKLTSAIHKLKRFVLTCGLKQYGVHLGESKQPMHEEDTFPDGNAGRIQWPDNFYHTQQRVLQDFSKQFRWEWIVTLPEDVIGFARHNFMNEATALGLFAAVSKALPGSVLPFPGSKANYFAFHCWTFADLHVESCLWAATAKGTGNQIARFGCKIPNPMFPSGGEPGSKGFGDFEANTYNMKTRPPLAIHAAEMGISDEASIKDPDTFHLQVDVEKWAQRKDVIEAWEGIRDKHNLDQKAWGKATWNFLTFVLGRHYSCVVSMSKARKLGWTGYKNIWDCMQETFYLSEKEGVLPPSN
ncbi:NAD dependent epimerase/dehydratase family protein [Aureobasidium sp. EXF-10727]|nr:NAD dependent epimerase/dehydratase family protein [Aureobasidium sp. EXF-10727]